jgi:hypothetical protein
MVWFCIYKLQNSCTDDTFLPWQINPYFMKLPCKTIVPLLSRAIFFSGGSRGAKFALNFPWSAGGVIEGTNPPRYPDLISMSWGYGLLGSPGWRSSTEEPLNQDTSKWGHLNEQDTNKHPVRIYGLLVSPGWKSSTEEPLNQDTSKWGHLNEQDTFGCPRHPVCVNTLHKPGVSCISGHLYFLLF